MALKDERQLEVWAEGARRRALIQTYPILAASGVVGPKLREGDRQVPEGRYRIVWLNPSSTFHLSMKLDYPNAFDREQARREGRSGLGGDIFIHGNSVSIGCIAVGDTAIEEMFVLAADTRAGPQDVIIAPRDLRRHPLQPGEPVHSPDWVRRLYQEIEQALRAFPAAR